MEWIKLAVLLAIGLFVTVAMVAGVPLSGHIADGVMGASYMEASGYASAEPEGIADVLSWVWLMFRWGVYASLLVMLAFAFLLIFKAMDGFAIVASKVYELLAWMTGSVRTAWGGDAAPPVDFPAAVRATVVARGEGGRKVTLLAMVSEVLARLDRLEAVTVGLEPPPPPKAPEEKLADAEAALAEKDRLLQELQSRLAALESKPAQVAGTPVPAATAPKAVAGETNA